jgi:hypothetical protein
VQEAANQWYQAGSLFIQLGFLIAAVWSVRTIAKSIRVSQEQMHALLRITLSGVPSEDGVRTKPRPTPYLLDGWPEATPGPVQATTETKDPEGRRSVSAGVIGWLCEPMAGSGIGHWRRMLRWLQAPAGS